jgi:integrase
MAEKPTLSHEIHKVRVRTELAERAEPWWGPALAADLCLGYRKISDGTGTWIARLRVDGEAVRFRYKKLGLVTDQNNYEAARVEALKWRASREAGVTDEIVTVADACREYVIDRRREEGASAANDAHRRFERTVYGGGGKDGKRHEANTLASIPLTKLRTPRLKAWRDGLKLSKPSSDRTMVALKAALNLAVKNRRVHPGVAREWGDVKPFGAKAGKRRDLFLDLKQRRALVNGTTGAFRDLLEGVALTGARAGELVNAKRSQFDARTRTMTFIGKTGRRDVPLSDAALALFKRLAESKLPGAFLYARDDGKPWAHSDWDELVRDAAKAAELPAGVCLYTLRHSFITQAITDGMNTLDVARLCGTSLVMVEKHYGHLVASAAHERLSKVTML